MSEILTELLVLLAFTRTSSEPADSNERDRHRISEPKPRDLGWQAHPYRIAFASDMYRAIANEGVWEKLENISR